ncbi:MAG: NACHT domain-containing protein [Calothrix sp. FI2-JRJ7]|jgi:WD40 repeat protein/DNA-binding CsgD family transcriptional regulator|nr:NACHT domain-containing protein [Calothrix sp. FI2-JRJ7]
MDENIKQIFDKLTPRRKEVLQMVLVGESDDAIASVLSIKPATVRKYLERLYQAFGVSKRVELLTLFSNYEKEFPVYDVSEFLPVVSKTRLDLGEAPSTQNFYGRQNELETLKYWIIETHCRVVTLLGMGGLGKTTLSVKLIELLNDFESPQFDFIIWRSLREAPKLEKILVDCIKFFSDQKEIKIKGNVSDISILIEYMRKSRCLIVLDNFESILDTEQKVGLYRKEYQDYSVLIKRISESSHQSCLVITSRIKPEYIAVQEGEHSPIRSLVLPGLIEDEGLNILEDKGLIGSKKAMLDLVQLYSGNPLALKIVSTFIKDLFSGDIDEFIEQGLTAFVGIESLLDSQFNNLSDIEKKVLYWLAINREPVKIKDLFDEIVDKPVFFDLIDSLEKLKKRSLIETVDGKFTLQNVVMEYMIALLIRQVSEEIKTGEYDLLNQYALIEATAKDYIRNRQSEVILEPICQSISASEINLKLVEPLEKAKDKLTNYAVGNILNLLLYNNYDLSGLDLSNLTIWQAYLRGAKLCNVNFTNSDLNKSRFTEAFGTVLSLASSPVDSIWAMGDTKSIIRVRYSEGQQWMTMEGHTNWVRSIAFSSNGKMLASASDDKTVMLWDTSTGQCLKTLKGHQQRVWSVAISPNCNIIASASEDKTIRLWRLDTGEYKVLEKHINWVRCVAFSPDGSILASGSSDKSVILWDATSGEYLKTLQAHTARVRSIAFSQDGKILASSSDDSKIILWDIESGKELKTLIGHKSWVRSVAFHPKRNLLASAGEDCDVIIWNVNTGKRKNILRGHTARVWCVTFCGEDCETLISSSDDKTVKIWDVDTGQCLKTFQGHTNWSWSVGFSPDGILVSGDEDQTIKIWDSKTGQLTKTLEAHQNRIRAIAVSPSGSNNTIIASGSDDKTIKLWDIKSGNLINTFTDHPDRVLSIAFSPDGKNLVSAGDDKLVRIWDVENGKLCKTAERHNSWIWSVTFSPDGFRVASGSEDKTIKLWNTNTLECIQTLKGHNDWVRSVKFHPNGKILASGSEDKTVKLWDVTTGDEIRTLKVSIGWVRSIAFSPDGRFLAVSGGSANLEIWDITTNEIYKTLAGHRERLWSVAFSPDGQTLASSSEDGNIALWDVTTGQQLYSLRAPRLYEGLNITGVVNLTKAQINTLKTLGAIKEDE